MPSTFLMTVRKYIDFQNPSLTLLKVNGGSPVLIRKG